MCIFADTKRNLSRTQCQFGNRSRGDSEKQRLPQQKVSIASRLLEGCFEACRQTHSEKLFVLLQVRMVEDLSCNRECKCLFPVLQKARCFALTLLSPCGFDLLGMCNTSGSHGVKTDSV